MPLPILLPPLFFPPPLSSYPNEVGPKHWTEQRFEQIMRLKQEAVVFARAQEAGYILVNLTSGKKSCPPPPHTDTPHGLNSAKVQSGALDSAR